jgi:CspA family cold shock protein
MSRRSANWAFRIVTRPDPHAGQPARKQRIMATGTIKSLRDRGFGFITPQGGTEDLFFHHSSVTNGGFEQMQEGQQVTFDTEPDPRDSSRSRAVRVAVVESDQD